MIKIGLVGGVKIWHGMTFAQMFNGYDKKKAQRLKWGPASKARIGKDVRITHVWDPKRADAEESADVCSIDQVVRRKEDMIGQVDGVILADDCTMKHQKRAAPFLKAGLPTFIDKPLSPDPAEAAGIIRMAKKHKAPLMSCSALRYAREVVEHQAEFRKLGKIQTGNSICGGDLVFYGIHAMELLYANVGPGIRSVRNIGSKGKDIVVLKMKDGRNFTVTVFQTTRYLFQMTLYGEKGWKQVTITDYDYFYSRMMMAFAKMVRTGKEPVPLAQTLEIIKTLAKAEMSRKGNSEIRV